MRGKTFGDRQYSQVTYGDVLVEGHVKMRTWQSTEETCADDAKLLTVDNAKLLTVDNAKLLTVEEQNSFTDDGHAEVEGST